MMTVKDLKKLLGNYDQDQHVAIALLITVTHPSKLEIHDTWVDKHGVVNLIAINNCEDIDPLLYSENNIKAR